MLTLCSLPLPIHHHARIASGLSIINGLTLDGLKTRVKVLAAALTAIQGTDYTMLRLRVEQIYAALGSEQEVEANHKWYTDEFKDGYGFDTYRPDEIPNFIREELRYRDTGNAFENFSVEILKATPKPTKSFDDSRKTASELGHWLDRGAFIFPLMLNFLTACVYHTFDHRSRL